MYMSFHQSVGMSVYQDVHQCVLCELNSSYSLFLFLKLCICFAHELMCMWFEHSSFFHLMNISILGISDAVNLFNYWCIPVLLFILYSATEKCGALRYTFRSKAFSVRPSVRHHFVSDLHLEYFLTDFIQTFFYRRVDIGEEWLGIIDGSMCYISTKILPFILKMGLG